VARKVALGPWLSLVNSSQFTFRLQYLTAFTHVA
jgi:hypothetical protein